MKEKMCVLKSTTGNFGGDTADRTKQMKVNENRKLSSKQR
jgi:hypothetical protein